MSRIGRKGIPVPSGVTVEIGSDSVKVKGPVGALEQEIPKPLTAEMEENVLYVKCPSEDKQHSAIHGLIRSLVANAVHGVSEGFEKALEIIGVGYNAQAEKTKLTLKVGFSHPVVMDVPQGIEIATPDPTKIIVKGCDKQLVGETAARIRKVQPPEPYKGKGIRYVGEHVRRKAGKSFVAAG